MTHDEEPLDPNTLYADGFEDALIGLGWQHTKLIAVYDYNKCVEILIHDQEMTHEEAIEWMEYNVVGSYVGEYTPIFLIGDDDGN
jgi:hypothetical protein